MFPLMRYPVLGGLDLQREITSALVIFMIDPTWVSDGLKTPCGALLLTGLVLGQHQPGF